MTERGEKGFLELKKRAEKLGFELKYGVVTTKPHRNAYWLMGMWNGKMRHALFYTQKEVRSQIVHMESALKINKTYGY